MGHSLCKGHVRVTRSPPAKLALYIIYFTLYHSVIWDIHLEYQWAFHACFLNFKFCVVEQENEKAEVLCKVPLKHCTVEPLIRHGPPWTLGPMPNDMLCL